MSPAEQLEALKGSIDFLARRLVGPAFAYVDRRDLEQDAIVAVLSRADRFDGSTKPSTFHGQRMYGAMVDGLRRWEPRRKNRQTPFKWCPLPKDLNRLKDDRPSTETTLIAAERAQQVTDAIATLPPAERYVIQRLFVDGATPYEVAKEIDRVPSRVFQIRRSGLARLRERFREAA